MGSKEFTGERLGASEVEGGGVLRHCERPGHTWTEGWQLQGGHPVHQMGILLLHQTNTNHTYDISTSAAVLQ